MKPRKRDIEKVDTDEIITVILPIINGKKWH